MKKTWMVLLLGSALTLSLPQVGICAQSSKDAAQDKAKTETTHKTHHKSSKHHSSHKSAKHHSSGQKQAAGNQG